MIFIEEEKYKNKIGIYCIINIKNNKMYIGQTSNGFQKRYWNHQWKLRKGTHDNKYLQNEWNKYGEDYFEFRVIEEVTKELLDETEKKWIAYYRGFDLCLNLQDGGQPENLGSFISEEQRKKIGEINKKRMTGSKLSEETKKKMSNTRKGKYIERKSNTITKEDARKIKELFIKGLSSGEIMKELNIPYRPINNILSNNTWAHVYVDGWDDFRNNREKGRQTKINDAFIQKILKCYERYGSYLRTAKELNIDKETVKKYVKLYLNTASQSCAKPQ